MQESYDNALLGRPDAEPPALAPRLGIVGGGQLARMTAMAALRLGCDVVILERNRLSPAATLATHALVGDWNDPAVLAQLAARTDVITLENEFVDAEALRSLEASGRAVFPGSVTVSRAQDKYQQKALLEAAGLPVVPYERVDSLEQLHGAVQRLGPPLVLKARRDAYDGRGNATVRTLDEADAAWHSLGAGGTRALYAEAWCEFALELATIVVRGRTGETVAYPVVETEQRNHVCHVVRAPARVTPEIAARVSEVARRAADAAGMVGSMGVECFLTTGGKVVINELAPRVHNSGHYTIEACACSQFENHVRAVLGLPLGSTRMVAPAAVMVNLLGARQSTARPVGLERALAVEGANVHLYGKLMSGVGRKLGHVTALGDTVEQAEAAASQCAAAISFGEAA
jgi:5-(carboxyamino)imidazole ribonucleotide synthase